MKKSTQPPDPGLPVIGWREWVSLPQLGIAFIKPKVDTGARSSSLHAFDVEEFHKDGKRWVRFRVHPIQRTTEITAYAESEVLEYRHVKSSGGHKSLRPVILTEIEVQGRRWQIELTLANRDTMGFRMLLGREAIRGRFFVDPATSYYGGKPFTRLGRGTRKKPIGPSVQKAPRLTKKPRREEE